jgi:hypothetical protein
MLNRRFCSDAVVETNFLLALIPLAVITFGDAQLGEFVEQQHSVRQRHSF